ncbi:MAG TPA: non-ribosomal peptide synthase/polyketide synthase, partial [Polyangia bacterium]|nr:non-ribosomal peptide synthase/polyketide synthase [Polyangia bacterium]
MSAIVDEPILELPLSPAQLRLWYLAQNEQASRAYHISVNVRIRGALHVRALRRALERLVVRHEALRTRFVRSDEVAMQVIDAPSSSALPIAEQTLAAGANLEDELAALIDEEAARPFDLERGPLIRARCIRVADDDHVLLLTVHHIVCDGWSTGVLVDELCMLYSGYRDGTGDPLPPVPLQYADFSAWQQEWLAGGELQRQLDFWKKELAGAPVRLELPADRPRPFEQDYSGDTVPVEIDGALARAAKALGQRHGCTLYMTLLAAWGTTLGRLARQQEVVIGSAVAGRTRVELESVIGLFVNTLAMRIDLGVDGTVTDLLRRARERVLAAQQHQDVPFEQVVEAVQPPRTLAHPPIFQVMFAWQNVSQGSRDLEGVQLSSVHTPLTTAKCDLILELQEGPDGIAGSVNYATALFERATVERYVGHFVNVLRAMVADDQQSVARLPLMGAAERQQVLVDWNRTAAAFPQDLCMHEMFEAQAARTPAAPAVQDGTRVVDYGELDGRANQLARHLRVLGVGPGVRVALCVSRSVEMVWAVLATLKAGGAYVPLDPAHPPERLAYMLKDSAPAVVLVDAVGREALREVQSPPAIDLSAGDAGWSREPADDLARGSALGRAAAADDVAYVIYTSGSTGRPKGVAIRHRELTNYLCWATRWYDYHLGTTVPVNTPLAFDATVTSLHGALITGKRILLVPEQPAIQSLAAVLTSGEDLTLVKLTPAHLEALQSLLGVRAATARVRLFVVGGEALKGKVASFWREQVPGLRIINEYGPTETVVGCCVHEVTAATDARTDVPIGRPTPNTRMYVLDDAGQPVPIGVTGELYIGGDQLGAGYLDQPALTAERFVADPFSEVPGARMYKTGDLGRWRADGVLEFLGRNDFQVKVRGFRIELGEVEARLAELEGVAEVAVLAREDQPGDTRLVAYYTGAAAPEADALRTYARSALPDYMVPSAYVHLHALPLTTNGKVDRTALPAPEAGASAIRGAFEAPVGDIEETLAHIWAEVLGVAAVGRHDNFYELGGHSLLAITLIERMRRAGLYADVRALFTSPTLAALAAAVTVERRRVEIPPNRIPDDAARITPEMLPLVALDQAALDRIVAQIPGGAQNVQDVYPLAPLQEGILFHHLLGEGGDTYLFPHLVAFSSRQTRDRFLESLQAIVDRHDILRTAIFWEQLDEPVQVVLRKVELPIEQAAWDPEGGDVVEQLKATYDPRRAGIDLRRAPLLRVVTADQPEAGRWLLLVLAHHIAIDHVAFELLVDEIGLIDAGRLDRLAPPVSFREFVAEARLGVDREQHEAFFRQLLGDIDQPTIPFGLADVRGDGTAIVEARRMLQPELAQSIRSHCRALGIGVASLAHLAWALVLARLVGRSDVVFGTVLFGRLQGGAAVDRVVGMLMNTLPLRFSVGKQTAAQALRETHALIAQLLRHEHASLALAQRCSSVPPQTPLFSTLLNYRHSPAGEEVEGGGADGVAADERDGGEALWIEERTNYPVTLSIDDLGRDLMLTAQVSASIDPDRICAFMQAALAGLVQALDEAPQVPVAQVDVLPGDERERLLVTWNETAAAYPEDRCIHELFEEQAERTPEAAALSFGGRTVSYRELDARAARVAARLRMDGVGPACRVAVCFERSVEMIVALLGAMKAGAAYVPLDPTHPTQRLAEILSDCQPAATLVHPPARAALDAALRDLAPMPVIDVHDEGGRGADFVAAGAATVARPGARDLAYVIYTSGSTGEPKGAMNEHRAVVNRLVWLQRHWQLGAPDVFLQKTPFTFDVSVGEIFCPLISGACLVIARPEGHRDPAYLADVIRAERVNVVHFVPSMLQLFLEHEGSTSCPSLRRVMCSGEALPASLVRRFHELLPGVELLNLYGPTEAAVEVTAWSCRPEEDDRAAVPIGRPIANARLYVLDERQRPAPVGVAGELYIAGVPVGRGYLNRPELTGDRFVTDPFAGDATARMYRTGDRALWQPDGTLEYLGRTDLQVKVRGFRIELGEIEGRLAAVDGVGQAVVVAREDRPGDQRLVAYLSGAGAPDADALRAQLRQVLPEYMVPAIFVHLPSFPLGASGKVDRRALPAPGAEAAPARTYAAPQGAAEEALARIWSEVLRVDRVGRNDDFFELGGHSLLAVTVVERLRRAGMHLEVRALFVTPVLADLALQIDASPLNVVVPPNLIPAGAQAITPQMLTLLALDQPAIDRIVEQVPGGAANVQDIYPLAPLQEGILFHHLMAERGDAYVLSVMLGFPTRARLDRFANALRAVIARHDILRTAVVWCGVDEPVQVVLRKAELLLEIDELDDAAGNAGEQLRARHDTRAARMEVDRAPLLRGYAAADGASGRWLLLIQAHHLAVDHATLQVLVEEVEAFEAGRGGELEPAEPFRNFVAQARLGMSRAEHQAFFSQQLGDVDETTAPYGMLDVQGEGRELSEARVVLPRELAAAVRERARERGASAATLVHLGWALVLARVSGRADVVFGTVMFGRMQGGASADRMVGMFINTLPARIRVDERSVADAVKQTHRLVAQLIRHEHAPLALAQNASAVPAGAPLFTSLLNVRHTAEEPLAQVVPRDEESGAADEGFEELWSEERSNYPVTVSVDDMGPDLAVTAQVSAPANGARVCAMMETALRAVVEALAHAPETPLNTIDVLPAGERKQLVEDWNATGRAYPRDAALGALFDQQAARAPEAAAVIDGQVEVSYAQLASRANRLAQALVAAGVQPGERVAVALDRSATLVAAQLGAVKAGAAYVPLDGVLPGARQALMVRDCGARVILTAASHVLPPELEALVATGELRRLDADAAALEALDSRAPAVPADGGGAAYVMYTSGSTGTPKGVVIPHRAVSRLVLNNGYASFGPGDRVAFAANPAFDASTLEVWAPLLNGGSVVVVRQETLLAPAALAETLSAQGVTVLWMTVGLFNQIHGALAGVIPRLRYLIVGGDALDVEVIREVLREYPPQHLLNGYGPTETTTFALTHEIGELPAGAASVPLGRPIANTQVYVLQEGLRPAPLGVAGELYVAGDGVALGYLNDAAQTAERFVADPFARQVGGRMYKTGDLGRWRADGTLEFLGRNDLQVKVRGFRIELMEIESQLAAVPGVDQVVVVARQDGAGDKRLVAYVVGQAETAALQAHAQEALPAYMAPAAYVRLDALPLTRNGKVDRRALPAPDAASYAARAYEAPVGPVEETLAQVWGEVLGVERVGRRDDFFALGGHSLLAVTVVERLRRAGLTADVRALFTAPTVAGLAARIEAALEPASVPVPPNLIPADAGEIRPEMLTLVTLDQEAIDRIVAHVPGGARNVQDIYPLAPLQEGILFHHLTAGAVDTYLLPSLLAFPSRQDLEAFVDTLQKVVDRHDILRTAVIHEGLAEPVQVVQRRAAIRVDWITTDPGRGESADQLKARFQAGELGVNVAEAPLMRGYATPDPARERWLLLLLVHHLAMDHTTLELLIEETAAFERGDAEALPPPAPFRDFIAQSRRGRSDRHAAFFREMLAGVDETTAPFGLLETHDQGTAVAEAHRLLDPSLSQRVRVLAREAGVSPATLVHVAFAVVVGRASGRPDPVFGTVLLGRLQADEGVSRVLGMLINTLPVRIDLAQVGARECVRRTHALLARLIGHEHASLAEAQRCSAVTAPAPLFLALLNYRHSPAPAPEPDEQIDSGPQLEILWSEERTNYPLSVAVDDLGRDFKVTVQVRGELAPQRVCAYFETALANLLRALEDESQSGVEAPVSRLEVLSDEERRRLVVEWNDTAADYPRGVGAHDLIATQAARTPDAVAVACGNEALTYRELDLFAAKLAAHLRALGVGSQMRVAVCLDRGLELVVALLATLKAGAAYVPLDPAFPPERLAFIVDDAAVTLVLTDSTVAPLRWPARVVHVDEWMSEQRRLTAPTVAENAPAAGNDVAYLIYTSGSTGTPKGVAIRHRSLVNFLWSMRTRPGLESQDVLLSVTTPSFDIAALELWLPLCVGARVVLAPRADATDGERLARLIADCGATVMQATPATWKLLRHVDWRGQPGLKMLCGGEPLTPELASWLLPRGSSLWNMYGPTETTVWSSIDQIEDQQQAGAPSIGRPIANTQMYVLDGAANLVPAGTWGELYIGGDGVAAEYWRRSELTAERFVPDPFGGGERLYRTGDLARHRPDGKLECGGRTDHQVKVRGYRIELGDVEARLATLAGVAEVVVVGRPDRAGETQLVAYYTGERSLPVDTLRAHARAGLPEAMVPAAFVHLPAVPLTPNGKIDRRALPAPDDRAFTSRSTYEPPRAQTEVALAALWSEVLGIERIGRHDSFFELGGHSLLAMQLASRVRRALGVEIDLGELLRNPVLSEQAAVVAGARLATEEIRLRPSAPREGGVPVSAAQRRLWFLSQLDRDSSAYHISGALRFRGPLDAEALSRALAQVVARHEALRTRFLSPGGEPVQIVMPPDSLGPVMRRQDLSPDTSEEALGALIARETGGAFDLEAGPAIRALLARLTDTDHLLVVTLHHLVADGWSVSILLGELTTLYAAFHAGKSDPLPPLPIQYADFSVWQRGRLDAGELQRQADYWQKQLAGAPDKLDLPTDRPRPPEQDLTGGRVAVDLGPELSERVRQMARRNGVTTYAALLAGWAAALGRTAGQDDVVIGSPVAGRSRFELEPLIGCFVNTLALRIQLNGDASVSQLLARAQDVTLEAQAHQDLPFEQLVQVVQPPRTLAYTPIFQAMLVWQNTPEGHLDLPGLEVEAVGSPAQSSQFDLTLELQESAGRIAGAVIFASALFDAGTIERLVSGFARLLDAMVADDTRAMARLPWLSDQERHQLLYDWNATSTPFPQERCIHELFEEQASRAPDAVALVFEGQTMSYGELNARADALARRLEARGIRPDARVAIAVERSFEMVVGLLGILKAGGAYVPLDPGSPARRLHEVLTDCAPVVLLTHERTQGLLAPLAEGMGIPILRLERDADAGAEVERRDSGRVTPAVRAAGLTSRHLAYVIYTSGSTGTPKGAMNEHRAVVNRLVWLQRFLGLGPADVFLQKTPLTFDVSVGELFGPLISGSRLVIARPDGHKDPDYLAGAIVDAGVTVVHFVPSMLRLFLEGRRAERCTGLRCLMCSGEALSAPLVQRTHQQLPGVEVLNLYGPTEAAVEVAAWRCEPADSAAAIPIGRPIANARLYVLDRHLEPAPVGVAGELYIGGMPVGRGYLNRPELTAERFLPDPYARGAEASDGWMYRTGDLARRRPDGALEYLGRNDFQVKLRGFRIELGEVEARLLELPGIAEAAVVARDDGGGDQRLVAYYTGPAPLDVESLRVGLRDSLPEHMVPSAYVHLPAMPLNTSGKLDRRALPAPGAAAYAARVYEPPHDGLEQTLAALWADVLGVARVGRRDNFFELGGHSLLAVTLVDRMRRLGLRADVRALFTSPTLAELAAQVSAPDAGATGDEGGADTSVPPNLIPPGAEAIAPEMLTLVSLQPAALDGIVARVPGGAANVQDIYPLAPLQEGILFHHLVARQGDAYLMPVLLAFPDRARLDRFAAALNEVIDRHDILRTAVMWQGLDEPVQVVHRKAPLVIETLAAPAAEDDVAAWLRAHCDPRRQRIAVDEAPLLRGFAAADPAQGRWLLMLLAHHLILDHTTVELVIAEMAEIDAGRRDQLPPPVPFRRFVAQARRSVAREEHEAFFRKLLADVDEPTAPFGLLDVQDDGAAIREEHQMLDPRLAARIRAAAARAGVSAASLMHLAFAVVLGRVSGRQDVVFGTVMFGRMLGGTDVGRVLGMFINTLPVRIRIGDGTAAEALQRTHDLLARLIRHEHASLVLAQRASALPVQAALFSALFNYRHSLPAEAVSPVAVAAASADDAGESAPSFEELWSEERTNYPVTVTVDDLGRDFKLTAHLSAVIPPGRVCPMIQTTLEGLLDALEAGGETPVAAIDALPAAERHQLVWGWNDTRREYPRNASLPELFLAQAERTPDAIAVIDGQTQVSYGELAARARGLAGALGAAGVVAGDCVAVALERSIDLVVAEVAVVMAGAAYVPLDAVLSGARQALMVQDCGARVILARGGAPLPQELDAFVSAGVLRRMDADVPARTGAAAAREVVVDALAPAYVMYTSGSTGTPKGVVVSHRAVARLVLNNGYAAFDERDRLALAANPAFDASTMELWGALLNGGAVVVITADELLSAERLASVLAERGVTALFVTTALFNQYAQAIPRALAGLRFLLTGGERNDPSAFARVLREGGPAHLIHCYGPTETTTYALTHEVREVDAGGRPLPLGRAIANTQVYVLDEQLRPAPVGVAGELYVGGDGVARGYLNQPDETARRFLVDPFREDGARIYRTGDLGRWSPEGTVEFLGRNDFQVKLRGFRIELGEVEVRLATAPGVTEVVVVAREDQPGNKRLVAYYVGADAPDGETLRAHARAGLPDYMVPSAYVRLEAMPLNRNGKIDRRALPQPESDAGATRGYERPRGAIEERLAAIWAEVLGLDRVGRNDNFFELGGHSLLGVTVIERARRAGLHAEVRALFTSPTLADLAASIAEERRPAIEVPPNLIPVDATAITPEMVTLVELDQAAIDRIVAAVPGGAGNVQDIYPLAPLQEGILFHHLL